MFFFPLFTSYFIQAKGVSQVFIKSQIMIPSSVEAAIHYYLGLNYNQFTTESHFKVLIGSLMLVISQMWTSLSLPAVAKYFPLGAMDTLLIFPSWCLKEYLIQKLVFHTLILPSHPTEVKYGLTLDYLLFLGIELYLTLDTQSEWLLFSVQNFTSPLMFHKNTDLSAPADTIALLSGEKAQVNTSFSCPQNTLVVSALLKSHNLKVLSQEDETKKLLSLDKDKSDTKLECPFNYLKGTPYNPSTFSPYKDHKMILLSLPPVTKTSLSSFSF